MRIGFLIDRWQPERGGAEAAMSAFAEHLAAVGHEVIAIAERGEATTGSLALELVPGPRGLARLLPRGLRERRRAAALEARAEELGCERTIGARHLSHLSLFWPHGGAHEATLTARVAARASAFGPIDREHLASATRPSGRHKTFIELEGQLMNGGAERIVCVSELVRSELSAAWPGNEERMHVIPNGVDRERFRPWFGDREVIRGRLGPAFSHDGGVPLLAFIAREPELKGLPVLTRALARLVDRPWRLVVAGPHDFAQIERYLLPFGPAVAEPDASGARFGRRWVFLPQVDSSLLLRAASLTVQPTWRDPCSLVTLESLAVGRRVLTTLANGASTFVLDGQYPPRPARPARTERGTVLFDAADEALLAEALAFELERDAAGDPEVTRRISEGQVALDARRTHAALEELLVAQAPSPASRAPSRP